jgi:translocation and assembly module TamA
LGRAVYAIAAVAALCVQAVGAPAFAAEARADVQGELDPGLRAIIAAAIGTTDRPVETRFEARRRARDAADDAIAALRSEGYYAYEVEPDVGEGDKPRPLVRVTPGRRFALSTPIIVWDGAAPEPTAIDAANKALQLRVGAPGRAADVLAAEGRAVAAVQKRGYADVKADPREVVVDHATTTVQPTYKLSAGQLVRLDGVNLTTDGRTSRRWVLALAPWKSGEAYDPNDVAELERRLLDTGVFDSVTVALAPVADQTPEGLRPVVVSLSERKRRTIEFGGSYSTSEGFGLDSRWIHYNVLGRADTVTLLARISEMDSRLQPTLTLPHWRRPDQTLTSTAALYRTSTDAYDESGVGLSTDVQRRYGKTSYVTVGVSADLSRTDEIRVGTLTPLGQDIFSVGLLGDMAWDHSDDPLNPKHGWKISARGEPTVLAGTDGQGVVPYLKLQAQASYYLPIGAAAKTVIATRLHLGTIFNASVADIPASRRFYAGGGGSVRGFRYQGVGPTYADVDQTPQGGISLLEASAELRQDLTQKWGLVAFVDAGAVGTDRFPGPNNLSIGAGVGVRYNLGFGPIRVDIATPVTNRAGNAAIQLYVSIGQSF